MKFYIDKIVIWLKTGQKRTLDFEPNKVNIITGGSNTGKTAILEIIDYCLFASTHKISESIINENVEWYGLVFHINDKIFTLARKSPSGNNVSKTYYFSSIGEEPDEFPQPNNKESSIRKAVEVEFKINRNIKVPFGGKYLQAGSKISLRYFLLFCTISQDIITHSEDYFDKQSQARYREALPRIFDLAVGIDDLENILKSEKRDEILKKIRKLEKKIKLTEEHQNAFQSETSDLIRRAKEYNLIAEKVPEDEALKSLRNISKNSDLEAVENDRGMYDQISEEIELVNRKIRNIQRFSQEYQKYKSNLKDTQETLKPIAFLDENYDGLIKTSIFDDIIQSLKTDLENVRQSIKNKTPLDGNIQDILGSLFDQRKELEEELKQYPEQIKVVAQEKEKYVFLGEAKAKFELYKEPESSENDLLDQIERLEEELEDLSVKDIEKSRGLFVNLLNEIIQGYINSSSLALENYGSYKSAFNYKDKKLELRPPEKDWIEKVGSSSNHMFLHLFQFLGLHEAILFKESPHVPSFLIIDQFSRPYWGEAENKKEKLDTGDIDKVKVALKLLDGFITKTQKNEDDFQMIIFEHIEKELWADLKNIHLVEEFHGGNALIPTTMLPNE